jgi:hypothetical protein
MLIILAWAVLGRATIPDAAGQSAAPPVGVIDAASAALSLLTGVERHTWYFAEGSSARTDRETLAFLNPGPAMALILTTLLRMDGRRVTAVTNVAPRSRGTLDASFAAGEGDLLAAVVRSSEPIVAERTIYHGSAQDEGTGAALTLGQTATAHTWYLPRQSIASGEDERIAILNVYPFALRARIAYVRNGRLQPPVSVPVPALSVVGQRVPGGVASAVVTNDAASGGLVVEDRTVYGGGRGYTVLPGLPQAGTDGYLVRSSAGDAHDFLMVFNPNPRTALLSIGPAASLAAAARRVRVSAGGQTLIELRPGETAGSGALRLHSDRPLAAAWAGFLPPSGEVTLARIYRGSAVLTESAPARNHVFAEGDTRALLSRPLEVLTLVDPGPRPAMVTVTQISTGGRVNRISLRLAAGASSRLPINGWGPAAQHGLIVTSSVPILTLRSIDFNQSTSRLQSTGASG